MILLISQDSKGSQNKDHAGPERYEDAVENMEVDFDVGVGQAKSALLETAVNVIIAKIDSLLISSYNSIFFIFLFFQLNASQFKELSCPICLCILKNTMTSMQCMHRFCRDCIIKAIRTGNKECPICKESLPTKRSLRMDPHIDALIISLNNGGK